MQNDSTSSMLIKVRCTQTTMHLPYGQRRYYVDIPRGSGRTLRRGPFSTYQAASQEANRWSAAVARWKAKLAAR